ncbi:HAD family hydrolase [Porphyromonas sp.]
MTRMQHLYLFARPTREEDQQLRALFSEVIGSISLRTSALFEGSLYSFFYPANTGEEPLRRSLLQRLIPWGRTHHSPFYFPSTEATEPISHVAFDLDGTLTTTELLPELARLSRRSEEMTELTELAMVGMTPFRESFLHRTQLLHGLSQPDLRTVIRSIPLPTDTEALLRELALTLPTAIITGAYLPFVEEISRRVGITTFIGSSVHYTAEGTFAGLIPEGIIDAEGKRNFLTKWTAGALSSTLYTGDGANDLEALTAVGHALFYTAQHGGLRPIVHKLLSSELPYLILSTR